MRINYELFQQSIEVADEIISRSSNLTDVNASADIYKERMTYLDNLLGADGQISFNPTITKDLTIDFERALEPSIQEMRDEYNNGDGGGSLWYKLQFSINLADNIKNEDLLSNTVSDHIKYELQNYMIDFKSPKLSKLLVKLYGEHSDVVKWYTNDCPKRLDKGLNTDYRVHLSILPHHITGMSYYAPYNWGGDKWITGWAGTSCMDTIKNSEGGGIYQLMPSLLDTSLAIAFLTRDDDDMYEPRYLARCLVRVAKVSDSQYVMVGARAFYTDNEMKSILLEGLQNEFDNFVHVDTLRTYRKSTKGYKEFVMKTNTQWNYTREGDCPECDGDGYDSYDDKCSDCDGAGRDVKRDALPYIDDPDIFTLTPTYIRTSLPNNYLMEKGYIDESETTKTIIEQIGLAC